MTELRLNTVVQRLDYGRPGSSFWQDDEGNYGSASYPGHAEGAQACQAL